jgi:hypothetical protein
MYIDLREGFFSQLVQFGLYPGAIVFHLAFTDYPRITFHGQGAQFQLGKTKFPTLNYFQLEPVTIAGPWDLVEEFEVAGPARFGNFSCAARVMPVDSINYMFIFIGSWVSLFPVTVESWNKQSRFKLIDSF